MEFDFIQFKNLSDELKEQFPNGKKDKFSREAVFRVVISRIYYAAFHHCLNTAERYNMYIRINKSSDHENLLNHLYSFRGNGKKESRLKDVCKRLRNLRELRNSCDYDKSVRTKLYSISIDDQIKIAMRDYTLIVQNFT